MTQFPFLDYTTTTFQVRNSSAQTFTAPYKGMVIFSDIKQDDTNGFTFTLLDMQTIQAGGNTELILASSPNNLGSSETIVGAYIMRSGQRLRIDAPDDVDVTVNFFRLP